MISSKEGTRWWVILGMTQSTELRQVVWPQFNNKRSNGSGIYYIGWQGVPNIDYSVGENILIASWYYIEHLSIFYHDL